MDRSGDTLVVAFNSLVALGAPVVPPVGSILEWDSYPIVPGRYTRMAQCTARVLEGVREVPAGFQFVCSVITGSYEGQAHYITVGRFKYEVLSFPPNPPSLEEMFTDKLVWVETCKKGTPRAWNWRRPYE